MAKGIFALEDLEDTDLAVEPVNEVDYIQAQNDLDDAHNELEELHETYDNADQDISVIEAVADSVPDTDESPVESTIIATEALIRKLGLPNYSLESYKNKTNKALKASLEETVEKTGEAKKSLFKKIWEKIVAFFKKAYEFITGLFKKKVKDVKKKVDKVKIMDPEEAINKAAEAKSKKTNSGTYEIKQEIIRKLHLEGDGSRGLFIKAPERMYDKLLVPKGFTIDPGLILDDFNDLFKLVPIVKASIKEIKKLDDMTIGGIKKIADNLEPIYYKLHPQELPENHNKYPMGERTIYAEIVAKQNLEILTNKLGHYTNEVEDLNKVILSVLDTHLESKIVESMIQTPVYGELKTIIKYSTAILRSYNNYLQGVSEYIDTIAGLLLKIQEIDPDYFSKKDVTL